MNKQKGYTVSVKLGIEVTTNVRAESYEDAITQARGLKADDFVTIPANCWVDGGIDKITFISEDD